MIIKKFRRKIQKTIRKFLKHFKEFYKTNETLLKIYEKLDIKIFKCRKILEKLQIFQTFEEIEVFAEIFTKFYTLSGNFRKV